MMQAFRNAAKPVVLLITITFLTWMIVDLSGAHRIGRVPDEHLRRIGQREKIDSRTLLRRRSRTPSPSVGAALGIDELEQVRNEVWEQLIQNVSLTDRVQAPQHHRHAGRGRRRDPQRPAG